MRISFKHLPNKSSWYALALLVLGAILVLGWVLKTKTDDLLVLEIRNQSGANLRDVAVDGFGKDGDIGSLGKNQSDLLHFDIEDLDAASSLSYEGRNTGYFMSADKIGDERFYTVTIKGDTVSVDRRMISFKDRMVAFFQ